MTTTPEPTDKLDATTKVAVNGPADETLYFGERIVRRRVNRPSPACFIWRSGCQGVALVGHQVVGKLQGLWGVPGCRGDAAAFVFATGGQPHIRGLGLATDPKTFVRRTVRRLRSSAARRGGLLTSKSRTGLCASTEAPRRPGSRERGEGLVRP